MTEVHFALESQAYLRFKWSKDVVTESHKSTILALAVDGIALPSVVFKIGPRVSVLYFVF